MGCAEEESKKAGFEGTKSKWEEILHKGDYYL
jgi:hypothetical protein